MNVLDDTKMWTHRESNSELNYAKVAVCHLPMGPYLNII